MNRLLLLFILITALSINARCQDTLFKQVADRSNCIVEGTVLEIGPKISHEAGILEYTIKCRVNTVFKGNVLVGDTLSIDIKEYTLKLGGRGDSLPYPIADNLIDHGITMMFLLNARNAVGQNQKKIYIPIDSMLGVLTPTPQMEFYLRFLYKQN